jgi:hypothetical protein
MHYFRRINGVRPRRQFKKKSVLACLACAKGLAGPVRPPRNSLAGLVRLNRCVQGVRPGAVRQDNDSANDARLGQTVEATCPDQPDPCGAALFGENDTRSRRSLKKNACGDWHGRREGSGWSGQAASKLPRGPRTAESLRAGRVGGEGRQATIPPTIPGSVRQSRQPARTSQTLRGAARWY